VAAAQDGGVMVDAHFRSTTNAHVWAAGDVAASSQPALTPVSSAHADVVAANVLHGPRETVDLTEIPTVVFAIPPLAAVGLGEAAAKKRGLKVRVHTADTSGWYSTRSLGASHSMTKVIVDAESDQVLGAHLLGPHAPDLVNVFAVAIRGRVSAAALRATTFAYPTAASDVSYIA
jgi:glutathione reductase (NADPH)